MKHVFLLPALFFSAMAWGAPAVLFEDVEVKDSTTAQSPSRRSERSNQASDETRIQPLSQRKSLRDVYENQRFDSFFDLKAKRRVGIGSFTSGATGLFGLMLELNFTAESSAITAFGGGPGYSAFNFQWKTLWGGKSFAPYTGIGYARWYNSGSSKGPVGKTTPSYLASKFLSENEKSSGEFAVNLITPNLGVQYTQLSGAYTGTALFAELTFLTEIESFSVVPTGALGAIYYF